LANDEVLIQRQYKLASTQNTTYYHTNGDNKAKNIKSPGCRPDNKSTLIL